MVSSVQTNGISQLQLLRAQQAFKATTAQKQPQPEIQDVASISAESQVQTQKVATSPMDIKIQKMTDEVNNFMSDKYGDSSLTTKDINYALKFGRSVLVDYKA